MGGRSRWHDRRYFGRLEQEDQRLKKHYDRWMDIVRSLQLESFILTKLTKPLVRVNLVGPQVSFRKGAPRMSGGGIIFWVGEARISEIEEEARHPLDGHPTATTATTVCWLLVDKALHTCQLFFLRGRINLVRPQVCGRELIAHLRFVRMCSPFLNSNVI